MNNKIKELETEIKEGYQQSEENWGLFTDFFKKFLAEPSIQKLLSEDTKKKYADMLTQ